jgi:hypothetical protein
MGRPLVAFIYKRREERRRRLDGRRCEENESGARHRRGGGRGVAGHCVAAVAGFVEDARRAARAARPDLLGRDDNCGV